LRIIEDSTFVKLDEFDAEKLYKEYVDIYKKYCKFVNKTRIELLNTKDKEKISYRRMVYDTQKELLENIIYLERYLPYSKRYYTKKQNKEIQRLTFDKKSNVGFIPLEIYGDNVEEIVKNKILKDEMLTIMKTLLSNKQYSCTYMYFWGNMTQQEIAEKLGINQSNVARNIENAINKIRESEYFLSFLENIL